MKKFIGDLGVVPSMKDPLEIFCDNEGAIALAKEHVGPGNALQYWVIFRLEYSDQAESNKKQIQNKFF